MMKTSTILTFQRGHRRPYPLAQIPSIAPVLAWMLTVGSLVTLAPCRVNAQTLNLPPSPTYLEGGAVLPASPTSNVSVFPGGSSAQQYVVYVPSTDPLLLDRLRGVEPGAFLTNYQGRSVIQVGRYNYYQNAQQQVATLAGQGIGAEISQAAAAVPQYSQIPAPPPSTYISSGELPPLPVVAVPQSTAPSGQGVAFGQPSSPYTAVSVPAGEMPLPPTTATAMAAPAIASTGGSAPYYVVIPTAAQNLPAISSQVIQLGTPADRVQQRQGPLGPNVAIGPFRDRGLAERWSGYFREAGIRSSRVVYEP